MPDCLHPTVQSDDLATIYNHVEWYIERCYGIPVSIAQVVAPNTGDFDGSQIQIHFDQDIEQALFILIHLFGHTVQWNLSEDLRRIGLDSQPGKSDEELARIFDYECDATRYSLSLLHAAGVHHLDRWATDWWYADWRYLEHFYRTAGKLDVRDLLRPGHGPLLAPLAIPLFVPQRFVSRWSF